MEMTNDLWLSIQAHRLSQRSAGKWRCGYERTTVKLDLDLNGWVCGECGELLHALIPGDELKED